MTLRNSRAAGTSGPPSPADPVELAQEAAFELAGLRVEPSLCRVVLSNGPRPLQPRIMQVLVALARYPGETVSREDLMHACWGDTIVGEDALTRTVLRLRELFLEAGAEVSIETVPRIGYRLTGPVGQIVKPVPRTTGLLRPSPEPAAPPPVATPQPAPLHLLPQIAFALGVVLLVISAIGLALRPPERIVLQDTAELRLTPVTFEPGLETEPALSPDGGQLVYLGTDPASKQRVLLMRSLAGGNPVPLTDEYAYAPAWSPDGGRIAYAKRSWLSPCRLYVRAVPGGTEREVGNCTGAGITTLTWAPDGAGLIYADRATDMIMRRLVQRDLTGSDPEVLVLPPPGEIGDERPTLSPDGKRLAFVRVHQLGNEDIGLLDMATRQVTILPMHADAIESVAWSADGKTLLATGYGARGGALWRVDVVTGARTMLLGGQRTIGMVANARLKDRVILEIVSRRENLMLLQSRDGKATTPITPEPLLESSSRDRMPAFSPNGKQLAFVSDRGGHPDLWISDAPFDTARRLGELNAGDVVAPAWSPDGTRIAVGVRRNGAMQMLVIDVRTGNHSVLFNELLLLEPVWSPAGDAIFYQRKDGPSWRLQRVALDGSATSTTVATNIQSVRSGLDDTHLLVRSGEDGAFFKLPLDGGALIPLGLRSGELDRHLWTVRAGAIFGVTMSARPELVRIDPAGGTTQILARLDELFWRGGIAVSPDATQFILSRTLLQESDLNLVEMK
ncbi:winged helix-turn-helix domain-containing protein [Roseiterribacter gracilis]|uniref:Transcriptional regulator n=1 Tax=Roseiterribacter gracilis TaxID=2812848 RepID=A0A8S8X8T8_9PROT|nr:transcriptional regulator [Rhodospirillales bacterium TMPK1]